MENNKITTKLMYREDIGEVDEIVETTCYDVDTYLLGTAYIVKTLEDKFLIDRKTVYGYAFQFRDFSEDERWQLLNSVIPFDKDKPSFQMSVNINKTDNGTFDVNLDIDDYCPLASSLMMSIGIGIDADKTVSTTSSIDLMLCFIIMLNFFDSFDVDIEKVFEAINKINDSYKNKRGDE